MSVIARDICSRNACQESFAFGGRAAGSGSAVASRCAFAAFLAAVSRLLYASLSTPFIPAQAGIQDRLLRALRSGSPAFRGVERRLEHSTALNNNFDRAADDKAEIAVGAAAINGDFGKAVRILIPERRAGRPIAEGCCALEGPRRHRKPGLFRQPRCAQASHRIAEMVDVDDFGKVVRPVCAALRALRSFGLSASCVY